MKSWEVVWIQVSVDSVAQAQKHSQAEYVQNAFAPEM